MLYRNFGTAISCIDGRIQLPIIHWFKETHRVDYVDMITEPGVERLFLDHNKVLKIKSKVLHSLNTNKSRIIVLAGHYGCEENPISKKEQITQIKNAVTIIKSWKLPRASVFGVWVNDDWEVEVVS